MNDLKKMGAIGGAVVLAACWPLAVGQIAQKVVTDGIAQLNQSGISAELIEYDRGYLSAAAKTRYEVTDPQLREQLQLDGLPTQVLVEHQIEHGIFAIDAESRPVEQHNLPFLLSTHTQLNGNTSFTLDIKKLSFQDQSTYGASMSVSRSTIRGSATVLGELDFSFRFPSTQVKFANGETVSLTELTGSGEGKRVNGIWHGDMQIALEQVARVTKAGAVLLDGQGLRYRVSSGTGESGERMQTTHQVSTALFSSEQATISDFNLDFTIGDVDADSFEKLLAVYQRNEVLTAEQLAQSAGYLDTLFQKGFTLSMDQMKLSAGDGYLDARWQLVMPQGTAEVSKDMSKIIPALTGSVDAFISQGLVEGNPAINEGIDELIVLEFVQPVEQGYRIDAVVEDGHIIFSSGQKLPLITLLMAVMAR